MRSASETRNDVEPPAAYARSVPDGSVRSHASQVLTDKQTGAIDLR